MVPAKRAAEWMARQHKKHAAFREKRSSQLRAIQWQDGVYLPGLKTIYGTGCGAIHQAGRTLYLEAGDLVLVQNGAVLSVINAPA